MRGLRSLCACAAALLILVGCASAPRTVPPPGQSVVQWNGRIALRVEAAQAQSFSAAFELKGNAESGELSLFSPLGATMARMSWAPGEARLRWDGKERDFDSLDALTREATGTELPVATMFRWLAGESTEAAGWHADLSGLSNGRLTARRATPAPAVEMRMVLD